MGQNEKATPNFSPKLETSQLVLSPPDTQTCHSIQLSSNAPQGHVLRFGAPSRFFQFGAALHVWTQVQLEPHPGFVRGVKNVLIFCSALQRRIPNNDIPGSTTIVWLLASKFRSKKHYPSAFCECCFFRPARVHNRFPRAKRQQPIG